MPPHSLVETDTGRFAYLERGDADAPLVLCLHGFPDHPLSYVAVMDELAAAGLRAVAPWMRGYAPSVVEGPYDPDTIAADVIGLADALSPNRPVALVGHDWGAAATYLAAIAAPHRIRCAVTMSVPHPIAFVRNLLKHPAQVRRSWYMLFFQLPRIPERAVPARQLALIRRLWRTWSPDYQLPAAMWDALERCLRDSLPAPLEYYRAAFRPDRDARRRMREPGAMDVHIPVRYLHGDRDGCVGAEMARGQERLFRSDYDMEVLAGAGHFLQLERPTEVAERIIAWLDAHP